MYICTRRTCMSIKIFTSSSSPPHTYERIVALEILQLLGKKNASKNDQRLMKSSAKEQTPAEIAVL